MTAKKLYCCVYLLYLFVNYIIWIISFDLLYKNIKKYHLVVLLDLK